MGDHKKPGHFSDNNNGNTTKKGVGKIFKEKIFETQGLSKNFLRIFHEVKGGISKLTNFVIEERSLIDLFCMQISRRGGLTKRHASIFSVSNSNFGNPSTISTV